MTDIWSFLLQTLTASGAAALLLAVKAMFRDKLPPRWQFGVWGLLGLALLLPAGLGGRYALVDWPWLVEAARTALTGECGALARVTAPVPLPSPAPPRSAADWLYWLYAAGAAGLLIRYLASYARLRAALRRGRPADSGPILAAAGKYGLRACPAVEVEGLPSAFVCGVFRPVLALPAGRETDEKVLLHELLHLKHHDAAWGLVVCLFRCLHWCNPLLWHCADLAGNDLEALCDQRVLERLEGEDRRDYGRILLSMADEKYARAPGTTSMANGGRQIRRRIEAIARFKRYPDGMALVSVCMALLLAAPLLAGSRAQELRQGFGAPAAMASARTTWCTTPDGALDAYAKAVLEGNALYRAMCAPLSEQNALAEQLEAGWDSGLRDGVSKEDGYQIYNLAPAGDGCEGFLALGLDQIPASAESEVPYAWMAVQPVRAERQEGRWVVLPQGEFERMENDGWLRFPGGCSQLPAVVYEAEAGDFTLQMFFQTTACIDSWRQDGGFFPSRTFDATPQPGGEFSKSRYHTYFRAVYTGPPERQSEIRSVGASAAPVYPGGERPELLHPGAGDSSTSGSEGEIRSVRTARLWEGDGGKIMLGGGGGGFDGAGAEAYAFPESYAADLYVNGRKTAELTLLPTEGGGFHA